MRWGLIGTGLHARQRVAPALARTRAERLHGVVGSTADKSAGFVEEFPETVAYPDLAAMLADPAIDAVFISTPNDQHRVPTEAAAAAGKHVLVEKPMALTEADCEPMIEACRRAGVKLGVGFQHRHNPAHRRLHALIADGSLGEPVMVRGEWHTAYGPWSNWRADAVRSGSDVLGAVGVHVLDLMGYLMDGSVTDVAALANIGADTGADESIVVGLRYDNNALGAATMTRRSRGPHNGVWVWGSKRMAGCPSSLGMNGNAQLVISTETGLETIDLEMPDLVAVQFEAFAAAVAEGRDPSASGEDGLRSVALSRRILAAQRTGD